MWERDKVCYRPVASRCSCVHTEVFGVPEADQQAFQLAVPDLATVAVASTPRRARVQQGGLPRIAPVQMCLAYNTWQLYNGTV